MIITVICIVFIFYFWSFLSEKIIEKEFISFYTASIAGQIRSKYQFYPNHSNNKIILENGQEISLFGYHSSTLWEGTNIGDSLIKDTNSFLILKIKNGLVIDSFTSNYYRKIEAEMKYNN